MDDYFVNFGLSADPKGDHAIFERIDIDAIFEGLLSKLMIFDSLKEFLLENFNFENLH